MQSVQDIKLQNTFKIVDAIRFNDGLTKKEIASDTGLSFATVSNICRELREKNLILETQVDRPNLSVGRSPHTVSLNYNEFFGVCIDVHKEGRIVLALTNLRNEIVIKKEICLETYDRLSDVVDVCYSVCMQICEEIGISKKNLLELCVAVPAVFDNNIGLVVGSSIALFDKQPLKSLLEDAFDLPVLVQNDSTVSSMAVTLNSAPHTKNAKNLIYIFCSIGLGVGVIAEGKQLTGCDGYAAEACHIPIGVSKLLCVKCGNESCVESDLSVFGFITKYLDYAPWDQKKVYDYWKEFLAAVESEDPKALAVVNENAEILGKLTSILVNLFDPEVIYVGGSISALFDRMKLVIETEVVRRLNGRSENRALLLRDSDEDTIIYGCAETIYNKINFALL